MAASSARDRDDLYVLLPAEFTRARNALVARLREHGDGAEARQVAKLRKPTAVVSAINRVARKQTAEVEKLIQSVERLRRAYSRAPQNLAEPLTEHRTALARVVKHVADELGDQRSPDLARRISGTLLAAAADRRTQPELRRGRLARELEPPGFEALAGLPTRHLSVVSPTATQTAPARERSQAQTSRARRVAEKEARRAQRAVQRLAAAASRQAKAQDARAARHQRVAERATRTADQLRAKLKALEETISRDREEADRATREAARLRRRDRP